MVLVFITKDGFDFNNFRISLRYIISLIIVVTFCYFSFKPTINIKIIIICEDGIIERLEIIISEMYIECFNEENTKALKASQPETMTDAIKITNMKYYFDPNAGWRAVISGSISNTTNYSFSKVVIIYDAVGTETYQAPRDRDCGDAVITITDVKESESRDFSNKVDITNITCQFEYDKLVFKSITAYK